MQKVRARIAARDFELAPAAVERALSREEPEPIRDHFVVVAGRRFPPKQVIAVVTRLDRADFTTNQARAILRRLGFAVGRQGARAAERAPIYTARADEHEFAEAEKLRPYAGRWVILKDAEVLLSGHDPVDLVKRLRARGLRGDSMFRVPADAAADMGGFPDV